MVEFYILLCYNHKVEAKRLAYYDLLKTMLIMLVVVGHIFEIFVNNELIKSIYLTIYSFHMPLFVFISGFFAKWKKIRFFAYLLMFVVFSIVPNCIYSLFTKPITLDSVVSSIVCPSWGMWFLLVMPFWNLSLLFLKRVKLYHVGISIIIALAVGFIPFVGEILSLSRMFYFFPFFLLGKWCGQNKDKFNQSIKKSQTLTNKLISVCLLTLTLFLFIFIFTNAPIELFYGKMPYQRLEDCFQRLLCIGVGLLNGLAFLILIPLKSDYNHFVSSFLSLGEKTLPIYVFHIYVLMAVKELCKNYLPLSLSSNLFFILTFAFCLTIIIVIVTSRKLFVKITNSFLKIFT